MIGELLDFTRGRLGAGLVLHRRPVDLGAVCRGVLEGLEEAASPGVTSLHVEGDVSGEWDEDRVRQLVGYLTRGALDASPKDTRVTLSLRGEADAVRLEVHPGAPIAETVLPVLFEPFHREARAAMDATPSGLGLSLYLARQLALAHGGTLEARTTPEGTTFTVKLPRRAP
jgi:signal transduction histidine kinase